MRAELQRRLGLPLDLVAASSALHPGLASKHGHRFDALGDVATNDGEQGHQSRHHAFLLALHAVCVSAWGDAVQHEPADYAAYSTYRPDLAFHALATGGGLMVGDLKLVDPLSSDPTKVGPHGALVAFANSLPAIREKMFGRAQRGQPSDGAFCPATGVGYVAPSARPGDYAFAVDKGVQVEPLLFETFGGFSPDVVRLLHAAAATVDNRLSAPQYDAATWSTRSWMSFSAQRLSVALHRSVAWELACALDVRGASAGEDCPLA